MEMGRLPVAIRLDLRHHCVETEIKRQYNRGIADFFRAKKETAGIETCISMLQSALENFDFQALRSRFADLGGHSDAEVTLTIDPKDNLVLTLNKKVIIP